tara:strand:- start:486 stop:746 length:261 start_codon:yes stop_codon:yes gene_type:complete
MIAFNKDNNEEDDKIKNAVKKLEKILEQIYFEDINDVHEDEYEQTNLSELLSLVYQALFIDQHDLITLSIKKNKNNSLSLKIEDLK